MDINDSNGRHVSVIVRPKLDHHVPDGPPTPVPPPPPPPTVASTDLMIKALAGNPWATALMMQYTNTALASMDRYEPSPTIKTDFSLALNQRPHHPLLQPHHHQPAAAAQTFGALLKAAMRNRNNASSAHHTFTPGAASSSAVGTSAGGSPPQHHQSQTLPNQTTAAPNRMSYPREFKLLVIGYYFNNGQNKYRTCKEFQITKSMLNGWLQKVDKIQQSRPGSLKSGRSGRKPQFPQVESELYEVYLAYLAQGKKVGNRWLRDTAKCIAQRRCSTDELNGMCQFSERWLCNFKKRFGINLTKDWNDKPSSADDSTSTDERGETTILLSGGGVSSDPQQDTKSDSIEDTPIKFQASPDTTVDVERTGGGCSPASSNGGGDGHKLVVICPEPTTTTTAAAAAAGRGSSSPPARLNPRSSSNPNNYEPGKRGRKVQFPQVERALFKKLRDKQIDGSRVSNRWLQDEARRLAVELCPQLFTDTFKSARCMFSEHWLHNFKKRYGITLKHSSNTRPEERSSPPKCESPLNLTVTTTTTTISAEPVSSSDDIRGKIHHLQERHHRQSIEERHASTTNGPMDDLPTMVPLSLATTSAPQIDFTQWYSKITTMIAHRNEEIPATPNRA